MSKKIVLTLLCVLSSYLQATTGNWFFESGQRSLQEMAQQDLAEIKRQRALALACVFQHQVASVAVGIAGKIVAVDTEDQAGVGCNRVERQQMSLEVLARANPNAGPQYMHGLNRPW